MRRGGERVRVGGPAQAGGLELQAEELPGLGAEFVQPLPGEEERDHTRHLPPDLCDPQLVPPVAQEGDGQPVPPQQHGGAQVERVPGEPLGAAAQVGAVGQLVAEAEGDGQVGGQVEVVPDLVAQLPARGPGGDDARAEHDQGGQGGFDHLGVVEDQPDALRDHVLMVGQCVTPDDGQHMGRHQPDQVPAAHRVPARQPVRADLALQQRDAGHQQQQDGRRVPGQQAGDPSGAGQPVGGRGHLGGVPPPHRQQAEGAQADQREHGPWHGVGREPAGCGLGPTAAAGRPGAAVVREYGHGCSSSPACVLVIAPGDPGRCLDRCPDGCPRCQPWHRKLSVASESAAVKRRPDGYSCRSVG